MDLGSSGGLTWGRSGQRFVSLWGGSEGWEVGAGDAVGPAEAEAEAEPQAPMPAASSPVVPLVQLPDASVVFGFDRCRPRS